MKQASYSTIQDLPRSGRQQPSATASSRLSHGCGSVLQPESGKGAAKPRMENKYAGLIAKDQIQQWLPLLASTLQRPRTQGKKSRRKKESGDLMADLQPDGRVTSEASGGSRF